MRDRIIVIDDEPNLRKILAALLTREGYDVFAFEGFDEALPTLNTEDIDVLITDLSMPKKTGMDVLAYCREYASDLPVVMITAFGTIEAAVSALKAGAFDFVLKPFDHTELARILKKAVESRKRRKREPEFGFISSVGVGPVPVPLFGDEQSTQMLRRQVDLAAKNGSPVLISGEIGSGKRSVAYEIHRRSDRSRHSFVQLHCEAIAEVFQVSELFGVEKGALPMTLFSKPGIFELGMQGTVVLEEIGALSIESQNALFTALENESFHRIGGAKKFPLDLRIITTTSSNLDLAVRNDAFHPELFYKLSVNPVSLKPLRERRGDIATHLVPYFLERSSSKRGVQQLKCSNDTLEWLKNQPWSGNIGELERTVEQMVNEAVARGDSEIKSL